MLEFMQGSRQYDQRWRQPLVKAVQSILTDKPISTTALVRALGIDPNADPRQGQELNARLHALRYSNGPLARYSRPSATRFTKWKDEDGNRRASIEWLSNGEAIERPGGSRPEVPYMRNWVPPKEPEPKVIWETCLGCGTEGASHFFEHGICLICREP